MSTVTSRAGRSFVRVEGASLCSAAAPRQESEASSELATELRWTLMDASVRIARREQHLTPIRNPHIKVVTRDGRAALEESRPYCTNV